MHYFSSERRAGRESKPYLVLNPKSDLDGSLEDFMAPEPLMILYVSLVIALRFPEEFLWRVHQRSWSFSWTVFCLMELRTQQLLIFHLFSHCPAGNTAKYSLLLMTSIQSFVTKVIHRSVVTTLHMPIGMGNGTYSMMKKSQPSHQIWSKVQSAPSKHTCMCLKSWAVSNQDSNLFSSSHARGSSWYSHS